MTITIFTPTYNRAHLLSGLYQSLLRQTNRDFEWIIGDDGSSDHTHELVQRFQREGMLNITYFSQSNSGKHVAFNEGVKRAKGELFCNLDSDDMLMDDAIQTIISEWEALRTEHALDEFAGLAGNKIYADGSPVGATVDYQYLDTTIIDYRFVRGIYGDKMEIFRTDILKQYPFPVNGENFCPEALVWNRIGSAYKFRFFNKNIFQGEYLPGGLSARIVEIRKNSPQNASTYYGELTRYKIPSLQKVKAAANYWRFCIYNRSMSWREKISAISLHLTMLALPLGLLMALKDAKR